jgi:hypothetical protein
MPNRCKLRGVKGFQPCPIPGKTSESHKRRDGKNEDNPDPTLGGLPYSFILVRGGSFGGRLIRSQGGWSQVVSARRRGQREEYDERILGSGDFVSAILDEVEEKTRRQLKFRRTGKTLTKIIEEGCKKGWITGNELRGGSRRRKVSAVRARVAKRAVGELGLSLGEIARHVGVTTSSTAKAVARLEEG